MTPRRPRFGPNEHCASMIEVMLPNAELHEIACGKRRRGHGRWHQNRAGVLWRGRWKAPTYIGDIVGWGSSPRQVLEVLFPRLAPRQEADS